MKESQIGMDLCRDIDLLIQGEDPGQKGKSLEYGELLSLARRMLGIDASQGSPLQHSLLNRLQADTVNELDDEELDQVAGGLRLPQEPKAGEND